MSNDKLYFQNKVTVTNFILAVNVMFIHSYNVQLYPDAVSYRFMIGVENFISRTLGNLAVPGFFLLSGYLFYRNYSMENAVSKYKSRIKSIVVPYLLWNLAYYVVFLILTSLPFCRYFMDTKRIPFTFAEIIQSVLLYKYNNVYWFMYQMILYIAVSPVIYLLVKKCGVWVAVIPYVLSCWQIFLPDCAYGIRLDMLGYWCLGCFLAVYGSEVFEAQGKRKTAVLSMICFIAVAIMRYYIVYVAHDNEWSHYVLYVLMPVGVLSLWFGLNVFSFRKTYWWMQITFFIYSLHLLLVDTIRKAWAKLLPLMPVLGLANYFLAVAVSLLMIICIACILMKHLPRLWSVFNGGRKSSSR